MQKIDLFNINHEDLIKSLKNGIASAKSKNKERHFVWAISLLDEYISMAREIRKSHPKKYAELMSKMYETIGDSYFGIKKIRCKSLDFDCVFEELAECLKTRFGVKGPVSQFMLTPPPKVTIIEQVGLGSCSLWCLPKTAATQTSTSGTSPRNSEQPQK
jgi:hypothetical protein